MAIKAIDKELDSLTVPSYNPLNLFGAFINVRMRYEDGRVKNFKVRNNKEYVLIIKNRYYFLLPQAVYFDTKKEPWIEYYFNNPCPLYFQWRASELEPKKMLTSKDWDSLPDNMKAVLTDLLFDSKSLHNAFTSKVFAGFYQGTGTSMKVFLWYALIIIAVLLVLAHVFGFIDLVALFNSLFGTRGGG